MHLSCCWFSLGRVLWCCQGDATCANSTACPLYELSYLQLCGSSDAAGCVLSLQMQLSPPVVQGISWHVAMGACGWDGSYRSSQQALSTAPLGRPQAWEDATGCALLAVTVVLAPQPGKSRTGMEPLSALCKTGAAPRAAAPSHCQHLVLGPGGMLYLAWHSSAAETRRGRAVRGRQLEPMGPACYGQRRAEMRTAQNTHSQPPAADGPTDTPSLLEEEDDLLAHRTQQSRV